MNEASMGADDPIRRVQQLSRPELPRRFYETATIEPDKGGYAVRLDGKAVRTPRKRPLVLPNAILAEAVAAEWVAQEKVIDPAAMPVTRIANVAIDGVADRMAEVLAEIVGYAGSDLICYRADEPDGLVARQEADWRPLVDWAAEELGARLKLAAGVVHLTQDDEAMAAVAAALEPFDSL
jgi:chaperone required for assembly of F1-ATPase